MANVLITTLGKARRNNEQIQGHGRYRQLRYDFGDNYISRSTAFFGKVLFDYLCDQNRDVGKIVILGTVGSMWDAWLEIDDDAFFDNEKFAEELQNAVDKDAVTSFQLERLSQILGRIMNLPVSCRLIPYGRNDVEQLEILTAITESSEGHEGVFLDVTHGLRHLPMLEMLSSFLMNNRFETQGFYYGAAELRQGDVAPTIRLDGAKRIYDWICAIAVLKNTGNVSALANMPGMEGLREQLLKCQFYEQMNDVTKARRFAKEVLDNLDSLPIEGTFFKQDIAEVFSWGKEERYARRQFSQAMKAFENGNYLRSVILFMETVISSRIKGDALNSEVRRETQEELNKEHVEEWHMLRQLRNSLAHGGHPEGRLAGKIMLMRQDESKFQERMMPVVEWVRRSLPD